jgi:hypothetical protein
MTLIFIQSSLCKRQQTTKDKVMGIEQALTVLPWLLLLREG